MRATPALDWQILTKRPEEISARLPADWGEGWANVWLGISAENQETFAQRWPILETVPAAVLFVSYEPALGPLRLPDITLLRWFRYPDWLIWGGESGPGSVRMPAEWARSITSDCELLGIPVFGKQWGGQSGPDKGAPVLDGRIFRQFPASP